MHDREKFSAACAFVWPFGQQYKGKTIARIGASTDGLKYLDWCRGQTWLRGDAKAAVETFLDHPVNSRNLDAALED